MNTLRTKEGIIELLKIETGKQELNIIFDLENYIARQQEQHPQRQEITIARQYLCEQITRKEQETELPSYIRRQD